MTILKGSTVRFMLAILMPIALLLALAVSLTEREPHPYPGFLQTGILFYPDQAIQYDLYSEDHFTHEQTRIEYADGITELISYTAGGQVRERVELYPSIDDTPRVIKGIEKYGADASLLFEQSNRPDGTAETIGRRLEDGNYEHRSFAADGVLVLEHSLFSPSGVVLVEELYSDDGIIESERIRNRDGGYSHSTFREDGTRAETIESISLGNTAATYYYEDGITPEYTFRQQTASSLTARHYRRDGTIEEERRWDMGSSMTVILFDETGTAFLRQIWQRFYGGGATMYQLDRVDEVIVINGNRTQAVRMIYLADDSVTPDRIWFRWDREKNVELDIMWRFRDDGTLESVEEAGAVIENHEASEAIIVEIPAHYLVLNENFPQSPIHILYPHDEH